MTYPAAYGPVDRLVAVPIRILGFIVMGALVVPFLVLKLILIPFERPARRSAGEVVQTLHDFLHGTGGPWDWDDFTSQPNADPRLDDIHARAAGLSLPISDADTGPLIALIDDAAQVAASELRA